MKEDILLRPLHNRLQYSSQQSQATDHNDDPHIYANMWQYIFNMVGVAVGFGAFWRFPYLIYKNGGGAFLVPYTISMVLVGVPLLYLQTAIGQMHRVSLPSLFKKMHPSLKYIGLGIMTAALHMSSVYNILITYCYRFFFASFSPSLPFANEPITSSINWTLLFIYLFSLVVCHLIIKDGAKTTGKIAIYTALGPFFILFILISYGLTLDGAIDGLAYLFEPQWSKLLNSQVWVDATTQVFYQLSIGIGIVCNLSSMKPRREDILKGVIIVPISLFICGLLSAATIFIYLSHFSQQSGIMIEDLKLAGPQLSFNVLPKALCLLPLPNLWLMVFFLAMLLLGISSEFGVLQAIYCCIKDIHKQEGLAIGGWSIGVESAKYLLLFVVSLGSILLASHAGVYYLQFFDYYMSNIPYTLWVITQLYFFVYIFKLDELTQAIWYYTKAKTPKIIEMCLKSYWLPGLLIANLLFATINQVMRFRKYTILFYIFGWLFTIYPLVYVYYNLRKHWRGWSEVKLTFRQINSISAYL